MRRGVCVLTENRPSHLGFWASGFQENTPARRISIYCLNSFYINPGLVAVQVIFHHF